MASATATMNSSSASLSLVPNRPTTKSLAPGGWWSTTTCPIAATSDVAPGRSPARSSETPRAVAVAARPASAASRPDPRVARCRRRVGRWRRWSPPLSSPLDVTSLSWSARVGAASVPAAPSRRSTAIGSAERPAQDVAGRTPVRAARAATIPPSARTSAWSNPGGISSTWWVTRTIARRPLGTGQNGEVAESVSRAPRSRLAAGSSRRSRSGSGIRARAIEARRRSPADSVP